MDKILYDKLVRDQIPQIIRAGGNDCEIRVLEEEEYRQRLEQKLSEELSEYLQSGQLEELADLLEVMMALVKAKGSSWQELEDIRQDKFAQRGGFEKRLLLQSVTRETKRGR